MKRVVLFIVFCLVVVLPNALLADEIYKDKDGVWRNKQTAEDTSSLDVAGGIVKFGESFGEAAGRQIIESQSGSLNRLRMEVETSKNEMAIQELKKRQESRKDFSGYERFDPATAGEVKSEWEYFDDPRSKK